MKKEGGKTARGSASSPLARIGNGAAMIICWSAPMVPSIRINLEAAAGQGSTWAIAAVGFTIFGAICVDNATHSANERRFGNSLLYWALALAFIGLSLLNAIGSAASLSEGSRDDRSSQIERKQRLARIIAQSSQARKAQFDIAGYATPDGVEGEIQAAKAADAKRWNATDGCDLSKITAGPTRTFCESISKLQVKLSAAKKRDELDAKIAGYEKESGGETPSSIDPFADNVARFIGMLGYAVDADGKVLITSSRDWGKAVGVELLGAFGPAGLLMLFGRIGRQKEAAPEPQVKPVAPVKPSEVESPRPAPPPVLVLPEDANEDATMHSFCARKLERCEGAVMKATPLFNLWKDDCAETGVPCGTQKAFSARIKKYFEHDPNGGRPVYRNVRKKTAQAAIRMVVSNKA